MVSIAGKVALITGASSGIGAATARTLVDAGAKVVVGARRGDRLAELVSVLGEENAVAVQMDARNREDAEKLLSAASAFGPVDILVAAAGGGMYGSILDGTDDEIAAMMDANYAGTVWAVRAFVRDLASREAGGDVVLISSVAGLRGDANEAVYAGTKAAQLGLAGALDRELRSKGIRVCSILPASVDTEFALGRGRVEGDPAAPGWLAADDVAFCVRTVLEQRPEVRTTLWAIWPMTEDS